MHTEEPPNNVHNTTELMAQNKIYKASIFYRHNPSDDTVTGEN